MNYIDTTCEAGKIDSSHIAARAAEYLPIGTASPKCGTADFEDVEASDVFEPCTVEGEVETAAAGKQGQCRQSVPLLLRHQIFRSQGRNVDLLRAGFQFTITGCLLPPSGPRRHRTVPVTLVFRNVVWHFTLGLDTRTARPRPRSFACPTAFVQAALEVARHLRGPPSRGSAPGRVPVPRLDRAAAERVVREIRADESLRYLPGGYGFEIAHDGANPGQPARAVARSRPEGNRGAGGGQPAQARTSWRCSPSPPMPRRITSPGFRKTCGFCPAPTPGGVPVGMTSPGSKVM